jgi:nucleoside-diphosphate-sugar epimerase
MTDNPELIRSEDQLEELLSRPGEDLVQMMSRIDGDLIFLGITGKIGPSLSLMAARACKNAGIRKRILGVSRTIDPAVQKNLDEAGIETVRGDLLDNEFLSRLPLFKNVIYLAGMKFGSSDNRPLTWAVNTYLPGLVATHFRNSRIVAFSTGCVYPLVSTETGGSKESDTPAASGEYAQSCLGRERMFQYGCGRYGTETALVRLNYSVEMRYGVLTDIALKVLRGEPIDLTMGYFNVIWQGDMNDFVLRTLEHVKNPANIINITGPEILSVREVALEFGSLLAKEPVFTGAEAETALLSDASKLFGMFGKPKIHASQVIRWIANWIKTGGKIWDKPTHYEVRDGIY